MRREMGDAAARCIVEPFFRVLEPVRLPVSEKLHWQRTLRAIVHGFVSQEKAGFFAHPPADAEVSFETAVQCYIGGLAQAEVRARTTTPPASARHTFSGQWASARRRRC